MLKMLAVDLKKFLTQVEIYRTEQPSVVKEKMYIDEFKELKKTIVNYYAMTKKYKEKFV